MYMIWDVDDAFIHHDPEYDYMIEWGTIREIMRKKLLMWKIFSQNTREKSGNLKIPENIREFIFQN